MKTPAYISHCLLTFVTNCLTALLFVAVVTAASATHQQTAPTKAQKQQAEPKRKAAPLTDDEIQEARTLLSKLGYWLDTAAKGRDASLRHALIAFQKIEDRKRTGVLTKAELEALRAAQPPLPQEEGYPHIEVDLQLQVLFVVEGDDAPLLVLPVSTGSGELFTEGGVTRRAITPTGRFKVIRKIEGWRKSPLGLLYYPNYIYDGIAIHGNPSVPARPASHGCIRIPMFAAEEFSQIAAIGMEVIVYDDIIP
jgi:lipoprotein-anchoring transpeptidase ErfK/SrfK